MSSSDMKYKDSLIKDWQLGQQSIFLMAIRTLVLFCIYKFAKTFEKQNQCQVVMLWYVISLRHAHHACFCFVISFRSKSIMMKIGRFKINMRPMLKIGESKFKKKASVVWYWLVLLVWFIMTVIMHWGLGERHHNNLKGLERFQFHCWLLLFSGGNTQNSCL